MFLFCSTAVLVCMQGRINHCAGCTMRGAPAARGPRSTAKFLPRCFDVGTFSVGLNVSTTTKKVVNFFFGGGEENCTPREKSARHRENRGYAYEKRLRWDGAPEWLTRRCLHGVLD